jgi:ParB-like chromosome segregation protein Spo0J
MNTDTNHHNGGLAPLSEHGTVRVSIEQIKLGDSPREVIEDAGHVRMLAESVSELPPIVVRSADLSVVDGAHRLAAQRIRGVSEIDVVMFDGDDLETYLESVRRNVYHGKPLTMSERQNAVRRILRWDSKRSDRSIAEICGLSPKVVADLRRCATAPNPQLNSHRVGKDGRARPVDPTSVRQEAAGLLRQNPDLSLREVARRIGTSVNTVRNVRQRLTEDEELVKGIPPPEGSSGSSPGPHPPQWNQDRALVSSFDGGEFAQWFTASAIHEMDWKKYVETVPLSRVYAIADEARRRAETWSNFAKALSTRVSDKRSFIQAAHGEC